MLNWEDVLALIKNIASGINVWLAGVVLGELFLICILSGFKWIGNFLCVYITHPGMKCMSPSSASN
ncbi:MAG: hypothetical protein ABI840_10785 [bacterium]